MLSKRRSVETYILIAIQRQQVLDSWLWEAGSFCIVAECYHAASYMLNLIMEGFRLGAQPEDFIVSHYW